MKTQTAVEWLCSQIYTIQVELEAGNTVLKDKIEQAKEMEKQQIIEFAENYELYESDKHPRKTFEQYYNETFKK